MTYQEDFTLPIEYMKQISEQGTEFLPELIRILVNAAMKIERQKHLGAGWRSPPHKSPVLQVLESLLDFLLGVHHKRTIGNDRFIE